LSFTRKTLLVIAGLDPAIHLSKRMDARLKAGHDEGMKSAEC